VKKCFSVFIFYLRSTFSFFFFPLFSPDISIKFLLFSIQVACISSLLYKYFSFFIFSVADLKCSQKYFEDVSDAIQLKLLLQFFLVSKSADAKDHKRRHCQGVRRKKVIFLCKILVFGCNMICALRVLVEGTGSRDEYIFEGMKKLKLYLMSRRRWF
jgi:hypothetical protein